MESKYYTPEISEFHVGFEYEFKYHKDNPDWFKVSSAKWQDLDYTYDDYEHQYDGKFEETHRVKYLDKEDIESLGFTQREVSFQGYKDKFIEFFKPNIKEWVSSGILVNIEEPTKLLIYSGVYTSSYPNTDHFRFKGIVKNKSELKVLLKQLGING